MKITLQAGDILTYRFINGVLVSLVYEPAFDSRSNKPETLDTKAFKPLIKVQRGDEVLFIRTNSTPFWTRLTKFLTVKFGSFKNFTYLCSRIRNNAPWCKG